jgi:hypothetical protein
VNKPIFMVGSPRSGTSILTWRLGQHPNIITLEECAGIGDLAVALSICYKTKKVLANPFTLANEIKAKRAIIDRLRTRDERYKLRRLTFHRHVGTHEK